MDIDSTDYLPISPTSAVDKRIALFGLSGNPPTNSTGHTGIIEALVKSDLFDAVWVMPVYQHIFSTKKLEPFHHRMKMCKISFERVSTLKCKVIVLEIEKHTHNVYKNKYGDNFRVGTIDILDILNKMYPGIKIHFVLGLDAFLDLKNNKWKESQRILNEVYLEVFMRKDKFDHSFDISDVSNLPNITIHDVPWLDEVSSTTVRSIISSNKSSNGTEWILTPAYLHPDVLKYIQDNQLYGLHADNHDRPSLRLFFLPICLILAGCLSLSFAYLNKKKI